LGFQDRVHEQVTVLLLLKRERHLRIIFEVDEVGNVVWNPKVHGLLESDGADGESHLFHAQLFLRRTCASTSIILSVPKVSPSR